INPPFGDRAKVVTSRSSSAAFSTFTALASTPNEGATDCIAPNRPRPADMAGSRKTAIRVTPGAVCFNSFDHSSHHLFLILVTAGHMNRGFINDTLLGEPVTDPRRAKDQGATVLAHRLRLYLALHEGADALDGRSRFRKDPRPNLPGVWHPRPYFEFNLTSGGAHPLRHAHGIIEEDLVAADLDERRRQSGRVGVKRRCIRRAWIGAGEIIAREPRALRASQHRIRLRVSLQGAAGEREIGPRRKRDGRCRPMKVFLTQLEQHC